MEIDLHGKTALVTGGSRGIGRAISVALASCGARVAVNYVRNSKGALESLVRHLAVELAGDGIRVNAVSAGVVHTDALKHFPNRDDILGNRRVKTPAGRLTEPEDVARVVLFLVSPLAEMVIGQTVTVDGGYSVLA